MKRVATVAVGIFSAVFLAGIYLSRAGSTPAVQPAMVELNPNVQQYLKTEFNRAARGVRAILLLSPTCPYCLRSCPPTGASRAAAFYIVCKMAECVSFGILLTAWRLR